MATSASLGAPVLGRQMLCVQRFLKGSSPTFAVLAKLSAFVTLTHIAWMIMAEACHDQHLQAGRCFATITA